MNVSFFESAGIDYLKGLKMFGDREELYQKYLIRFTEDKHLEQAITAYQRGDISDVLKEVQSVRGMVGTLAITSYYEACEKLVTTIQQNHTERIGQLLTLLEEKQEVAWNAIREL